MNDDEARYLIDQFNKYAYLKVRQAEIGLSRNIFVVATTAVFIALMSLFLPQEHNVYTLGITVLVFVVFFVLVVWSTRDFDRADERHKKYERWLTALEDHRSKHKLRPNRALPDSISFKLLVEHPEDLDKLLKESEGDSPQTSG